jgi:hypothetical protein
MFGYQSNCSVSTMKTFAVFILVIFYFELNLCFLSFPLANQLLHPFLETLDVSDTIIDKNLMKYAVDGEECMRECKANDQKVCYFNFTMKHYQVMGA